MDCKQYRAEIEGTDNLAGARPAAARSHAAACAACRVYSDDSAALRALVAGLARVDAPPDFEFRLRARIAADECAEARSWSKVVWARAAWLAAAGCLAFAATVALQVQDTSLPAARGTAAGAATYPVLAAGEANTSRVVDGEAANGSSSAEPRAAGLIAAATPQRRTKAPAVGAVAVAKPVRGRYAAVATAQPPPAALAPSVVSVQQSESSTMSMIGSPVVVSTAIPLPVAAGGPPLRVMFKDMQGESRVVRVDPVTFGSDEPAARQANVTYTKGAKKQGVW